MMDKADLKQFGEFIGSRLTAKRVSQTRFGSILGEVRGGVIVDKGLLSKIISGTYVSVLSPKTSWGIDCITALAQLGCIEGMEDVRRGIELVGHTLSHDDIENIKSILQSRKENLEISSDSDLYSAQEISTPESNYSPQTHNLPPKTRFFVGREKEIQAIKNLLYPGNIVTVWGLPGMGKTTVVTEALRQIEEEEPNRFTESLIHHTFRDVNSSCDDVFALLAQRGDVSSFLNLEAAARQAVNHKQIPILLDSAENCRDLNRLLDVISHCPVIITTRNLNNALDSNKIVEVKGLSKELGVELLKAIACHRINDDSIAEEVCKTLDGWPLMLASAASYIVKRDLSIGEYKEILSKAPLVASKHKSIDDKNLYWQLGKSTENLSEDSADILTIMASLAFVPIEIDLLAQVLKFQYDQIYVALDELYDWGIINYDIDEEVCVTHHLIYDYLRDNISPNRRQLSRMCRYYRRLLDPGKTVSMSFQKVIYVREHIKVLALICEKEHLWYELADVVVSMLMFLGRYGLNGDVPFLLEKMQLASQHIPDKKLTALAEMLDMLKAAYFARVGKTESALQLAFHSSEKSMFRLIIDQWRNTDLSYMRLYLLGDTYVSLKKYDQAEEHLQKALKYSRNTDDKRLRSGVLKLLAYAYIESRNLEKLSSAELMAREAQELANELNIESSDEELLLGMIYHARGKMQDSLWHFDQALRIVHNYPTPSKEMDILLNRGLVYSVLQDRNLALADYQRALSIAEQLNDTYHVIILLSNLVSTYLTYGEISQAARYQERMVEERRLLSEYEGEEIPTLDDSEGLLSALRDYDISSLEDKIESLLILAMTDLEKNKTKGATEVLNEAIKILNENDLVGVRELQEFQTRIAALSSDAMRFQLAQDFFEKLSEKYGF